MQCRNNNRDHSNRDYSRCSRSLIGVSNYDLLFSPMAEPIGTSWKLPRLILKSWGEEVVVFNLASGHTHLLNPVAAQALKILEQKPLSADELSQRLASLDGLASDEQLIEHVKKLLSKLDEMGLIEPAF